MAVLAIMTAWHEKMFQNSQFTQKITSLTILLALILGIAASFMNFQARHINWQIWEQNKSEFFFEETPLFTTMDAGFFLGIAGHLKSGQTVDDKSQYLLDESMYQMKFHINNKSNERKN